MELSVVGAVVAETVKLAEERPFADVAVRRTPVTVVTVIDELVAPFGNSFTIFIEIFRFYKKINKIPVPSVKELAFVAILPSNLL